MIREYKDTDLNSIIKLGKELHNNYKFSLDEFSKCLVCEIDNSIIGFVIYSIIYERAEIVDIIIKENYRGKKFGYNLLKSVIYECNKNNCINITLEVNELNKKAIAFYSGFDFKIVSRIKNYYNKGQEDAYLMEMKLR